MTPPKKQIEIDREQRQAQMKRRILDAAMKLFVQQGFDNITMRNIAAAIGFSPGATYRYFESKDDIFFALRGEGFDRFYRRQLDGRTSGDPARKLREHALVYIGFALDHPEYYEIMFLMRAPVERAVEKKEWHATKKSLDLLRDDLREAAEAGLLAGFDLEALTLLFWSSLHGVMSLLMSRRTAPHSSQSPEELATKVVDCLLQGCLKNP